MLVVANAPNALARTALLGLAGHLAGLATTTAGGNLKTQTRNNPHLWLAQSIAGLNSCTGAADCKCCRCTVCKPDGRRHQCRTTLYSCAGCLSTLCVARSGFAPSHCRWLSMRLSFGQSEAKVAHTKINNIACMMPCDNFASQGNQVCPCVPLSHD